MKGPTVKFALLALLPFGAIGAPALRAQDTAAGPPPAAARSPLDLPPIERRTLDNGIEVAVMRDTARVVHIGVALDVGPALDPADKPGLGDFVKAMLSLGTTTRSAAAIAEAASALGSRVTASFAYAPLASLDRALLLLAEQLLHPAFTPETLDQLKANATANLRRTEGDSRLVAAALFKKLLYGPAHPYAREQTAASIAAIARDDVVAFYAQYVRPPNVRFAVVGDISADSAVAKLNRHFGAWPAGAPGRVDAPPPAALARTAIYLHDQPGSTQSMLWIGGIGPRRDAPDYAAVSVMNTVLGGSVNSRLNLNLRRQHRYTPNAQSGFAFFPVPEPGLFAALATVPAARTDSALTEMMREIRDIGGARPMTDGEFRAAHTQMTRQLPMELGTTAQRMAAIVDLLNNRLPLDHYQKVSAGLATMSRADADSAARSYLRTDRLAIVVVGDRATVEAPLRAANVAPVVVVDRNGAPVTSP